jgi:hypothetical protein
VTNSSAPRRHAWLFALFACLALPARAQPLPNPAALRAGDVPDARKASRVIALLPVRSHDVGLTELFSPDAPRQTDVPAAIEAQLLSLIEAAPYVTAMSPEWVRLALAQDPTLQPLQQLAQVRYRQGLEQFLNLSSSTAIQTLQMAVESSRAGFQDVIDPKPLADALVMLGVCLLDRGEAAKAHIALRDAFAAQADRRFRPNFFAPAVNGELAKAFVDWRETADLTRPWGDHRRMHALADKLGADGLVYATVRPTPEGPELWLAIYDARRRVVDSELRVPLADSTPKVDAFLSRWLACLPVAESEPDPSTIRRDDGVRLDMSGGYALYLKQPTRQNFHSVGFSVGVAHEFRNGIEWFGRAHMYTSLSDPYRDVLHAFNSVRIIGGLGFTWRSGPLRLYARPGLDAHLLGDFIATTDPNCKFFGVDHPLCDKTSVADLQQRLLFGLNLAVGASVHIGRNFFVHIQGSSSLYFLPLGGTEKLNYPTGGDLGLGYAF